jgi:hypothetical protein
VATAGFAGTIALVFGTPLTLKDGRVGTSSAAAGHPELAAKYLHHHYTGGDILADDSRVAAFVFAADLDLDQFITPGFHPYWERALVDPAARAQWLVTAPGDAIATDMQRHPDRFVEYRTVSSDRDLKVLERVPRSGSSAGTDTRRR